MPSRVTFSIPVEQEHHFLRYLGEEGGIDLHHNPFDMLFAFGEGVMERAGMRFEFTHRPDRSEANTIELTIECLAPDCQAEFVKIIDRIAGWMAQGAKVSADEEEELRDLGLFFLRRKLAKEEEGLQLIEDRLSECAWETDEPLPLIEAYRQQLETVEELRRQIGARSTEEYGKRSGGGIIP